MENTALREQLLSSKLQIAKYKSKCQSLKDLIEHHKTTAAEFVNKKPAEYKDQNYQYFAERERLLKETIDMTEGRLAEVRTELERAVTERMITDADNKNLQENTFALKNELRLAATQSVELRNRVFELQTQKVQLEQKLKVGGLTSEAEIFSKNTSLKVVQE